MFNELRVGTSFGADEWSSRLHYVVCHKPEIRLSRMPVIQPQSSFSLESHRVVLGEAKSF